MGDWDEDGGWGGEEMAQDDDDTSWKVRRGAIKVILAIIHSRPEKLRDMYENFSEKLVLRFKERDDKIQGLILHTFAAMLRSTLITKKSDLNDGLALMKKRSSAEALTKYGEFFVTELLNITTTKHQNIKIEIMNVIKEMSRSLDIKLSDFFPKILPFIKGAFEANTSSAL